MRSGSDECHFCGLQAAKPPQAQRCGAGGLKGQTQAAEGGCRAEQACEPRSIAAARMAADPKKKAQPLEKLDLRYCIIAILESRTSHFAIANAAKRVDIRDLESTIRIGSGAQGRDIQVVAQAKSRAAVAHTGGNNSGI